MMAEIIILHLPKDHLEVEAPELLGAMVAVAEEGSMEVEPAVTGMGLLLAEVDPDL